MVVESHFSTSFSTSFHQKYLKNTYSSLTPKTTKKSPQTAGNPWFSLLFREIFLSDLKPLAGLEPATHALRMRCATNCATMAHLFKKIRPLQMQQPHQDDLTGNRTRVYAVRGRRLDRLTIRPCNKSRRRDSNTRPLRPERSALPNWATLRYFVVCFCYVVQRKTYYIIGYRNCQQVFWKKLKKFSVEI